MQAPNVHLLDGVVFGDDGEYEGYYPEKKTRMWALEAKQLTQIDRQTDKE